MQSQEYQLKTIIQKNSYPEFDNSAMDGVVINENDYCLDQTYKIVDEIKAGDKKSTELKKMNQSLYLPEPQFLAKIKLIIPIEELQFIEKKYLKFQSIIFLEILLGKNQVI